MDLASNRVTVTGVVESIVPPFYKGKQMNGQYRTTELRGLHNLVNA